MFKNLLSNILQSNIWIDIKSIKKIMQYYIIYNAMMLFYIIYHF